MKVNKRVNAKINLNHIEENFMNIANHIGNESKIFCVVKADGYGHGSVPIAKHLASFKALYGFAVATFEEAMELRNAGITHPILILGYTFPDCYEKLAIHNIMPTVFREDMLTSLSEASLKVGKDIKVHIKVDTGMGRIGIAPNEEGVLFIDDVLHTNGLVLDGIFTHFARADETDKTSALEQFQLFKNFVDKVENKYKITIPCKHVANSAAIAHVAETYQYVVRAGIALYGLWPSEETPHNDLVLKPSLSLHSHIVYIKDVEEGSPIGYGGTYITPSKKRIATVPIGYADGYPRALSNTGYVLIRGKKAPIVGRICMDQMMVDVTDVEDAMVDDLVTLIGRDEDEVITVEMLGAKSNHINYEYVCLLGKRVPRIYTYNGIHVCTRDFYNE